MLAHGPVLKRLTTLAIAVFLLLFVALVGRELHKRFNGSSLTVGGNFTLESVEGPWEFSKNASPLNLIYFGFTSCPDVCPLTLGFAGQAFRQLSPDELQKTRLVFVSVDPDADTPGQTQVYAQQFFPSFVGLTGSGDTLKQVLNMFGAVSMKEPNPNSRLGYSISHTDRIFFTDREGQVLESVSSPRNAAVILEHIKRNL